MTTREFNKRYNDQRIDDIRVKAKFAGWENGKRVYKWVSVFGGNEIGERWNMEEMVKELEWRY